MRRRSRSQAGEGQFGCIFGLAILLIAVFFAYKIVPVKVKAAELRQVVVDEGKSAGTHNDEKIRKAILAEAEDQGLPVTDDDIEISRTGNLIKIDVDYIVPIKFPGRTWEWHFHHSAENPIF
jgi:predicted membrane protein